MAVTKRTRYEVLRRDNHACRYCGAVADDTPLTIDHVVPVSLGGTDNADNLAAACKDCNAGKASISPDQPLVEDVQQKAFDFRRGYEAALQEEVIQLRATKDYQDEFATIWEYHTNMSMPRGWKSSVGRWHAMGVPMELLEYATEIAADRPNIAASGRWKYMCGIVWGRLSEATGQVLKEKPQAAECFDCGRTDQPLILWPETDPDSEITEEDQTSYCASCLGVKGYEAGEKQQYKRFPIYAYAQDLVAQHCDRMVTPVREQLEWVS